MKITDLKCTILGNNPVIRITTDEGIAFHSGMPNQPNYFYGEVQTGRFARTSGPLTERGLKYTIDCIQAMKDVLGTRLVWLWTVGPD